MSLFENDMAKEILLGKFLCAQYKKRNWKTTRITDKRTQLQGVDLILEHPDGIDYKIDEKAQLHYLNCDLPTFALEINYKLNETIKKGWLFDDDKITEVYAFIFSIHLIEEKKELKSDDDIKSCELIFVKRSKLTDALAALELNYKTCNENAERLRSDETITKLAHPSGFNFQLSNHLEEKPVNLIVKKKFLASIGEPHLFYKC